VQAAWKEVGIRISGARTLSGTATRMRRPAAAVMANGRDEDAADIARKIEQLSGQLAMLSTEIASLKSKPH